MTEEAKDIEVNGGKGLTEFIFIVAIDLSRDRILMMMYISIMYGPI